MVIGLRKKPISRAGATGSIVDYQQLLWLVLLSAAYLLRDIVGLPMPDIIFTGLCGMAFLFLSSGSAMGVYVFTTALTVPDFEIRIVYLAVLLAQFWLKNKKFNVSMLLVVLGMALLELLDMMLFSSQTVVGVLYTVAKRMAYFVLPLFWFSEDHSAEDYRRALLCYVAGVVLGGGVMLYMSVEAVGWPALVEGTNVRLGMNTTGGYETQSQIQTDYNANQLGSMFAITISIVIAMMDRKYITKLLGGLLVGCAVFMVLLTKSRTAMLLTVGIMVVYWFVLMFRRGKVLSGMIFLLAIVALIYGIAAYFPGVVEDLLARFQDESNLTGGRDELFVLYIAAWLENVWVFLFGYGIGSYQEVVDIFSVPHNILADIAISWGLVGLLCIVYTLCMLYRHGAMEVKKDVRLVAGLPALVAFIAVLAGQYLSTGFPHMRQCFLILAVKAFIDYTPKNNVPTECR